MATNGNLNHVEQYNSSGEPPVSTTTPSDSATNTQKADLPKDEVGWYFVEQYYTTLSKNPEKLHLFYGKKSQFVYGLEAEVANISVGRSAIQERIKELSFQDCKVRISNVDSQGSNENIIIQVIGETSNNGAEPKKFVQTFVLAQQPSGYFVLNDILRYINDFADDEVADQDQPVVEATEPVTAPEQEAEAQPEKVEVEDAPKEPESTTLDTAAVDKKLEEAEAPAEEAPVPAAAAEEAPEAAPEVAEEEPATESIPDPVKAAEEAAEEEVKQPEDPKAPTPTPAVAPAARVATPIAAEPEKPKQPPKPFSWANLAASAAASGPPAKATAGQKPAATPASTQVRTAAPAVKQSTPSAPANENTPAPAVSQDTGNEWQTAETKRQNRPQSQVSTPAEKETTSGYVKYVTEKIQHEDLRATLAAFGELSYFDINRSKNCAFVEFKTPAGYSAAVAANPHIVNGESIVVEPRRQKTEQFRSNNFNTPRGGATGRGRGGFETGRSGSQGGRGGFPGQARGGRGGAPRGRGGQAGAA